MPRRSKKSKKVQIPSCPFALGVLPELHELIFQHFDAADVLILSETSKLWWNSIGESKKCMEQVRLGLENWEVNETAEDFAVVMDITAKSTRRYQNVRINSNDDRVISEKAVQLLKHFAPSLTDLRFLNADDVKVTEKFNLPRLERLQFINNVCDVDELLLYGCTQLRELNLKHHYWADCEPVRACLKQNPKLEMLKLWDTGVKLFTEYDPSSYQFKLKRFATGCDGEISSETQENFIKFLETQNDSIEAIRFRSGLNGVEAPVINKIFRMSAMKIIHLDGIGCLEGLKLKINPNIIELRLPWSHDTLSKLTPFLSVVPRVRALFLRKINMEILTYVAMNLKELQILYYTRAEGCMGCFKKIVSANKDANKEIMLVNKEWY